MITDVVAKQPESFEKQMGSYVRDYNFLGIEK
jgi:hypothetical protein